MCDNNLFVCEYRKDLVHQVLVMTNGMIVMMFSRAQQMVQCLSLVQQI